MKKISNFLVNVFSIGVIGVLLAGALAFVGYVVAMMIGGELATEICAFIYKTYFPAVIQVCSVCVGCGLVAMYLNNVVALTFSGTQNDDKK